METAATQTRADKASPTMALLGQVATTVQLLRIPTTTSMAVVAAVERLTVQTAITAQTEEKAQGKTDGLAMAALEQTHRISRTRSITNTVTAGTAEVEAVAAVLLAICGSRIQANKSLGSTVEAALAGLALKAILDR